MGRCRMGRTQDHDAAVLTSPAARPCIGTAKTSRTTDFQGLARQKGAGQFEDDRQSSSGPFWSAEGIQVTVRAYRSGFSGLCHGVKKEEA